MHTRHARDVPRPLAARHGNRPTVNGPPLPSTSHSLQATQVQACAHMHTRHARDVPRPLATRHGNRPTARPATSEYVTYSRMLEEAVNLGVRRENVLATLAAVHAAQHVGLAALLVQVEQARIVKRRPRPLRVRSAAARPSSTWDCRAGRARERFSHLVGISISQRPLSRCTARHWFEADEDGVHARAGSARRGSSAPAR
jgi:hypothetical protein